MRRRPDNSLRGNSGSCPWSGVVSKLARRLLVGLGELGIDHTLNLRPLWRCQTHSCRLRAGRRGGLLSEPDRVRRKPRDTCPPQVQTMGNRPLRPVHSQAALIDRHHRGHRLCRQGGGRPGAAIERILPASGNQRLVWTGVRPPGRLGFGAIGNRSGTAPTRPGTSLSWLCSRNPRPPEEALKSAFGINSAARKYRPSCSWGSGVVSTQSAVSAPNGGIPLRLLPGWTRPSNNNSTHD